MWFPNSENWLKITFSGSARELVALVVDLLDVALGAGRPDDVGRVDHPVLEPVEALAAHALGQHGDAAAAHEPRDRDAAAAVVAGRGPDRAVARRVELPGDDPRREAAVGGEHLVRADHREAVAERDDDRRVDAGQLARQHDVVRDASTVRRSASLYQWTRKRLSGWASSGPTPASRARTVRGDQGRVGELGERRQSDAGLAEAGDRPLEHVRIDDLGVCGGASVCTVGSSGGHRHGTGRRNGLRQGWDGTPMRVIPEATRPRAGRARSGRRRSAPGR